MFRFFKWNLIKLKFFFNDFKHTCLEIKYTLLEKLEKMAREFRNFKRCFLCKSKECEVRYKIGTHFRYSGVFAPIKRECPKKIATYGMSSSEIDKMMFHRKSAKNNVGIKKQDS